MKPRDIARKELKLAGYVFKRNGANHDIYYNEKLHSVIPLKRHNFNENDLKYIRKEIEQNRNK